MDLCTTDSLTSPCLPQTILASLMMQMQGQTDLQQPTCSLLVYFCAPGVACSVPLLPWLQPQRLSLLQWASGQLHPHLQTRSQRMHERMSPRMRRHSMS